MKKVIKGMILSVMGIVAFLAVGMLLIANSALVAEESAVGGGMAYGEKVAECCSGAGTIMTLHAAANTAVSSIDVALIVFLILVLLGILALLALSVFILKEIKRFHVEKEKESSKKSVENDDRESEQDKDLKEKIRSAIEGAHIDVENSETVINEIKTALENAISKYGLKSAEDIREFICKIAKLKAVDSDLQKMIEDMKEDMKMEIKIVEDGSHFANGYPLENFLPQIDKAIENALNVEYDEQNSKWCFDRQHEIIGELAQLISQYKAQRRN